MQRINHLTDIASVFKPGCQVVLHSACASPPVLGAQLTELAGAQGAIDVFDLVTFGKPGYLEGVAQGLLHLTTLVPGRAVRGAMRSGAVRMVLEPLSRAPARFADGTIGADVLLLHLSPPDEYGLMSLGIACDVMHAVLARTAVVVAEINPDMPRTSGQTAIRREQVHFWLEGGGTPISIPIAEGDATDRGIADNIAGLIENGDVLQTGIGSILDLTLARLRHHTGLGIHTGMLTDAVQNLIERGVVRGKVVATLAAGSGALYRFLHDNPGVVFLPCDQTHGAAQLAAISRLCAVNAALEVDLSGRVNAEVADGQRVSGPGGQPDFARGATVAPNGKSIIALRATSKGGTRSRIVPTLAAGSPVTIDTGVVDYVVTEFGVARVRSLSGGDLVRQLATVAAPEFREALRRS